MGRPWKNCLVGVALIQIAFLDLSCGEKLDTNLVQAPKEEPIYATALVGKFSLTLSRQEGDCVLSYKNAGGGEQKSEALDLAPPCNFLREYKRDDVRVVSYKKGSGTNHIVMVAGGPIYPGSVGDRFQPEGCGTETQGIAINEDRVEILMWGQPGAFWACPSRYLDEMVYLTQMPRDPSMLPDPSYKNALAPEMIKVWPKYFENTVQGISLSDLVHIDALIFVGEETITPPALNGLAEVNGDILADLNEKRDLHTKIDGRFDLPADVRLLKVDVSVESTLEKLRRMYPKSGGLIVLSRVGIGSDLEHGLVYVEHYRLDGTVKKGFCLVSTDYYDLGTGSKRWFDVN